MLHKFILKGKTPVQCDDLVEWATWFETANRHVKHDTFAKGKIRISTVFLGMDHGFGEGPPILFETMIFGGKYDDYQTRCSTWDEAEKMHQDAIDLIKQVS